MYNEAQKRATAKYMKENLEDIKIRVKKGERANYKALAEHLGMSVNQLFVTAVQEYAENHDLDSFLKHNK